METYATRTELENVLSKLKRLEAFLADTFGPKFVEFYACDDDKPKDPLVLTSNVIQVDEAVKSISTGPVISSDTSSCFTTTDGSITVFPSATDAGTETKSRAEAHRTKEQNAKNTTSSSALAFPNSRNPMDVVLSSKQERGVVPIVTPTGVCIPRTKKKRKTNRHGTVSSYAPKKTATECITLDDDEEADVETVAQEIQAENASLHSNPTDEADSTPIILSSFSQKEQGTCEESLKKTVSVPTTGVTTTTSVASSFHLRGRKLYSGKVALKGSIADTQIPTESPLVVPEILADTQITSCGGEDKVTSHRSSRRRQSKVVERSGESIDDGIIQCGQCQLYIYDHQMEEHMQTHSVLEANSTMSAGRSPPITQPENEPFSDKVFTCPTCQLQITGLELYVEHSYNQHYNTTQRCPVCEKVVGGTRSKLRRHILIHENLSYPCSICGRSYNRRDNLIMHMRTHEKESQTLFYCPICRFAFSSKSHRDEHMETTHNSRDNNAGMELEPPLDSSGSFEACSESEAIPAVATTLIPAQFEQIKVDSGASSFQFEYEGDDDDFMMDT